MARGERGPWGTGGPLSAILNFSECMPSRSFHEPLAAPRRLEVHRGRLFGCRPAALGGRPLTDSIFFAILWLDMTRAGALRMSALGFCPFRARPRACRGGEAGTTVAAALHPAAIALPTRRSGTAKMGRRRPGARTHLPGPPALAGAGGRGGGRGPAAAWSANPSRPCGPLGHGKVRAGGTAPPSTVCGAAGTRRPRRRCLRPRRHDRRRPCAPTCYTTV